MLTLEEIDRLTSNHITDPSLELEKMTFEEMMLILTTTITECDWERVWKVVNEVNRKKKQGFYKER